jgi:hypothetical protein
MTKLFTAGKWYGHCVARKYEAADLTGILSVFTITGGPVKVTNMGVLVTTTIPAGANTITFQFTPTGGSATDLSGATNTASAGAQQLFLVDGVKATAVVKTTDVGIGTAGQALHMPIVLSEGLVTVVFSGGPPATGAVMMFMEFEPLSQFTQVQLY